VQIEAIRHKALSSLVETGRSKGLPAEMAIRFEKAFGVKADALLRMPSAYALASVRAHAEDIKVERFGKAA
jgi:plasmid maintenance system antidote protein VapI